MPPTVAFNIADDGETYRIDDLAGLVDHFRQGEQPGVGKTERAVLSASRNMHAREPESLN